MSKLRHFFTILMLAASFIAFLRLLLRWLGVAEMPVEIPMYALLIASLGYIVSFLLEKRNEKKQNSDQ